MKTIYSSAECVSVWLGADDENDHEQPPTDSESMRLTSLSHTKLWSLVRQRDQVWWRRLWVIQEVVLCPKVFVWVGWQWEAWEQFVIRFDTEMRTLAHEEFAPYLARREGHLIIDWQCDFKDARDYLKSVESLRVKLKTTPDGEDLLKLLEWTSSSGVTVAADRIYSLLGLSSEEYRRGIPLEYGVPRRCVYAAVVEHVVRRNGNMDILSQGWHRGGGIRRKGGQGVDDYFQDDPLPTWMPNFSRPFQKLHWLRTANPRNRKALGQFPLTVDFKDGKELWLRAIAVDVLEKCEVAQVWDDPVDRARERHSSRKEHSRYDRFDRENSPDSLFYDGSSRRSVFGGPKSRSKRRAMGTDCFMLGFDSPRRPTGTQILWTFETKQGLKGSSYEDIETGDDIIWPYSARAPFIVRLVDGDPMIEGNGSFELFGEWDLNDAKYKELKIRVDSGVMETKTYRII